MNKNILSVLFALIFVLIVTLTVVYTRAADPVSVSATVTVTNATSSVNEVRISNIAFGADSFSGGIPPNVGSVKTVYVTGVVSDANGDTDVTSVDVVFYRTSKGSSCALDKNDCYTFQGCPINASYGNTTEASFSCLLDLAYWIDATAATGRYASDDWTALVTVTDSASATSSLTKVVEVNTLLALNIPTVIQYGELALGEETSASTNQEMILTQHGNTRADVEVEGGLMTCSIVGSIPVGAQRWSLIDEDYASSTNILSGNKVATQRNIDYRESESTELTASLFWNIGIPTTSVKGNCTGSNTISILAVSLLPVDADGNTYNTVTIGTQTWLATNMRVGTMVTGATSQTNNSTIEKYCYNDTVSNCTSEGALYQWNEAMQYSVTEGAQGICPSGYHIPTDNEYKTLEIFLGMTQAQADATGWRGTDQGTQLKVGGSSGFEAALAGYRNVAGAFNDNNVDAYLWSSSMLSLTAWRRILDAGIASANRNALEQDNALSVRCLKD